MSDRREGGRWTAAQRVKNDALYAAARAALVLLHPLPAAWLRALGRAVGLLAYAALPRVRRIAMANLERAAPGAPRSLLRRTYANLGGLLGDTVALLRRPHRFEPLHVDAAEMQVLDGARAEARGVVFVSAHLGPWERVAASLVAAGVPLVAVAREAYDARLTKLYDRLRGSLGVGVIYRGAPGAAACILRALRRGGVLGVPMDLRSRVPSVRVPFLGHLADTPVGPARLALRTRAPVVVGTAAPRGPGQFAVTFKRIATEDLRPDAPGELELTRRINAELSRRILALPDAWVWMHARWRDEASFGG